MPDRSDEANAGECKGYYPRKYCNSVFNATDLGRERKVSSPILTMEIGNSTGRIATIP
ncbi:hypothetical protein D9M71_424200 [compost metagenome]